MPQFGVWTTHQHYVADRKPNIITHSEHDARVAAMLLERDGRYRPCVARSNGQDWVFLFHVNTDGTKHVRPGGDSDVYDKGRSASRARGSAPEWDNERTVDLGPVVSTRVVPPITD
ncbi:hypothetical protein ACXYTP_21520 [Tsukamurella ocularis]